MSVDPRWGAEDREAKALAIRCTLGAMLDTVPSGTWVDMGCGSGGIIAALAPHVERAIGIDPEPWPRWPVLAATASNLEFRQLDRMPDDLRGVVDVVVCNHVYEHASDPRALIADIHRALRPGGYCYFAGPNWLWPIEPHVHWPFVHWMSRRFTVALANRLAPRKAADLDANAHTVWRLRRWFREAGFDWVPAEHARALAAPATERSLGVRLLSCLPAGMAAALSPIMPTFVFVLQKR